MGPFWACSLLAMGAKEDVPFLVAALGLYTAALAVLREPRRGMVAALRLPQVRHGLLLSAVALAWLGFTLRVVFPYFRGGEDWPYFAHRYGHLGSSLSEALRTLVTRPQVVLPPLLTPTALALLLELLVPLAFLPLLAPGVLVVAAPPWFIVAQSSFAGTMNSGSRYMAPLVPVLFVALVLGVRRLAVRPGVRLGHVLRWPLVLALLSTLLLDNTPLRVPFKRIPLPDAHTARRREVLRLLPPGASVSTQADFYGHVAHRVGAYMGYQEGVEYLLVDRSSPLWFAHARWNRDLRPLVASGRYRLVHAADGVELYRRPSVKDP